MDPLSVPDKHALRPPSLHVLPGILYSQSANAPLSFGTVVDGCVTNFR